MKKNFQIRDHLIRTRGTVDGAQSIIMNWVVDDNLSPRKAYEDLREKGEKVPRAKIVWDQAITP